MSTLKENWKKVGDEFTAFGKDLGKTIVKTVKESAKAVSDWADKDEEKPEVTVEPDESEKKE